MNGLVPEAGDKREDFVYVTGYQGDFTVESWKEFVNEAVAATKHATEASAKWQNK